VGWQEPPSFGRKKSRIRHIPALPAPWRGGFILAMLHNRIEPGHHAPKSHPMLDETWPRSWPCPPEEIRQRRRSLRLANLGFSLVAFLLLAVAVLSILYVGPSPIAGPGAPSLHSRSTIIR
jgi:hypothetical protein